MINSCCKFDLRWLEGVLCWEINRQEKCSALIGAAIRPQDGSLPVEHVFPDRTCGTLCWGILRQVVQFLVDSLQSHGGRKAVLVGPWWNEAGPEVALSAVDQLPKRRWAVLTWPWQDVQRAEARSASGPATVDAVSVFTSVGTSPCSLPLCAAAEAVSSSETEETEASPPRIPPPEPLPGLVPTAWPQPGATDRRGRDSLGG